MFGIHHRCASESELSGSRQAAAKPANIMLHNRLPSGSAASAWGKVGLTLERFCTAPPSTTSPVGFLLLWDSGGGLVGRRLPSVCRGGFFGAKVEGLELVTLIYRMNWPKRTHNKQSPGCLATIGGHRPMVVRWGGPQPDPKTLSLTGVPQPPVTRRP